MAISPASHLDLLPTRVGHGASGGGYMALLGWMLGPRLAASCPRLIDISVDQRGPECVDSLGAPPVRPLAERYPAGS